MPTFIQNSDGSQSEVFTTEELEAKVQEVSESANKAAEEAARKAIEEFKSGLPNYDEKISELENALKEAKEKGSDSSNPNHKQQIERLRKERDEALAQKDDAVKKIQEEWGTIKNSMTSEVKTELIDKLSNGNNELKEKIEFFYDNFKGDATTKQEIEQRVIYSYQLANDGAKQPNIMDNITSQSNQKGDFDHQSNSKQQHKPTENEVAIGNALGISDADREKYGRGSDKAAKTVK